MKKLYVILIMLCIAGCASSGPKPKDIQYDHELAACKAQRGFLVCQYWGPNRVCECATQ